MIGVTRKLGAVVAALVMASAGLQPQLVWAAPDPEEGESGEEDPIDTINADAFKAFKAGDYDLAAKLFQQAYELNPEPNYLFNIGRVYEEKGDLPAAVEYYQKFVKQPRVELSAREKALERLRVLKGVIAETEVEKEPDETPVEETPEEPDEGEKKPKTPPMRIAGYALLGVGGAALITGAALGGVAVARNNELDDQDQLEDRDSTIAQGKRSALAADILFITGGAIALTGLILTLVSLRKKGGASRRASLAPGLAPGGASLQVSVAF